MEPMEEIKTYKFGNKLFNIEIKFARTVDDSDEKKNPSAERRIYVNNEQDCMWIKKLLYHQQVMRKENSSTW